MNTHSHTTAIARDALRRALDAVRGVALLRGALDDEAGRAVLALLARVAEPEPDARAIAAAYTRAFVELAVAAAADPAFGVADAWQTHLINRIVDDANPWSVQAERAGADNVAAGLGAQAERDLRALRLLYDLDAATLRALAHDAVVRDMEVLNDAWAPWLDLAPPTAEVGGNPARAALCRLLSTEAEWTGLASRLVAYWARHGTGVLARFRVFRWEGRTAGLHPITHPDPATLDALFGYERERALLRTNTERYLAGLPAHDALLYGPPGTGKSSTVKAIAHAYAADGLRLIELRKSDAADLPAVAAAVRGRAPRFLLFVDDLSFEEHETEYKALKALLEGTAEARPANLLLYATTNRRNLVRETFAERGAPGDDVQGRDTMGEKVSLAARFGLRVTFALPNQDRYVAIATGLARRRGIALPDEELRARALLWERQHPGRSGRTARQFVDDLEAETRGASRPAGV